METWQENGLKQRATFLDKIVVKLKSGKKLTIFEKDLYSDLGTNDEIMEELARDGNKWAWGVLRSRGLVDYTEADAGEERVIRNYE